MPHKFDEKVRFSYFLPYGFTSQNAAILGVSIPEIARMVYSPEIPMEERLKQYERAVGTASKQINRMVRAGYVEDMQRKYGKYHWEQFRMLRLTKSGLYLLTNTYDREEEATRVEEALEFKEQDYRHALTLMDFGKEASEVRQTLSQLLSEDLSDNYTKSKLEEAIREGITTGKLTLLAIGMETARDVSCIPKSANGRQQYQDWKLSNIQALFAANGFLTYLDRRPIDTGWVTRSIEKDDNYYEISANGKLDISAFMYHTLRNWYDEHPNSYLYRSPYSDIRDQPLDVWYQTPAFYSIVEIEGFYTTAEEYKSKPVAGTKHAMRHTLCGVAVGSKTTYTVHHTVPCKTPWIESAERNSMRVAENTLKRICPGYADRDVTKITNAIMVCHTGFQFEALFRNAQIDMPKRWRKLHRVGAPYDGVYIIPINASGAMQLRGLMLKTPLEFENMVLSNMLKTEGEITFETTQDPVYQLQMNRPSKEDSAKREIVPVLVAHSMDFQRLYYAWEDYLDGSRFAISCYPGQVKFLRKIMPEAEFI